MSGKSGGYSRVTGLRTPSSGGLSAYKIALQEGFEGTQSEWVSSLAGEDGAAIIDIDSYPITAQSGSDVSVTLTHNIGHTEYLLQIIDSNNSNVIIPITRNANEAIFYFGEVTTDADYTVLISGANTTSIVNAVTATVTDAVIETIAVQSPLLPEINSYTITANIGTNVFVTLTHNLAITDSSYIVQIIDANKDNIVMPFTRNENDVVFYFGEVTIQQDYRVIIVH